MALSEIARKSSIQDFLADRRFAMVGVSRNSKDFSRTLFREFLKRGYDVIPTHPNCVEMEGRPCAASISAIAPPVESVLLMTSPSVTEALAYECVAAGVKRVWMYRGGGAGAVNETAVAYCQANGIDVIAGECPFMFLPQTAWIHRLHGFVRRISGTAPR